MSTNNSMNNTNSNISWVYYLIFGIDGLLIACLVMYLVMSGFNKKTFKEVFANKDKVIIYVLSIVILTTGISCLSCNCSKKGSSSFINNMNQGSKLSYSAEEEIMEDTTITDGSYTSTKSDSWGNSGSNGGDVVLNMTKQKAIGNIVIDNISTLDITMKDSSYYEGIINGDSTAKEISLTLDSFSKIKLTGDCYVTFFSNSDSNNSNIDFNGYKLYVNGVSI